MHFKLLFLLISLPLCLKAQSQLNHTIKELLEDLIENLPEEYDLSELEEQLVYYYHHPINLNDTDEKELSKLTFLSPIEIASLLSHRKTYGALLDIMELQQIDRFDVPTIRRLLPFVTISTDNLKERINYKNLTQLGKQEILFRFGTLMETSKGYTSDSGNRYLGSKEKLLLKYSYSLANRLSFSLTIEKDAGEFLFKKESGGFDYQSAHLAISKIGIFEQIVLGDYTLQFGQGLTLWSGYSGGKAAEVSSIVTKNIGLKPYRSTNEYDFFRGAATRINIAKQLSLTTFFSSRNLDASIKIDTILGATVTSINKSELHRTLNEIENKNNLNNRLFGGIISYQRDNLNIGTIMFHQAFNHRFNTTSQAYTTHRFTGKTIKNFGLFYQFNHRNGYYFGEMSKGSSGGWAHLNGVLISLSSQLSAIICYRKYAPNYHNFFHQAIAESSESTNEEGLYTGINLTPHRTLTLSFCIDYFKFPWLKFRIDAPSSGYEMLCQAAYTPRKEFKVVLKYKSDTKQQNTDADALINFLEEVTKENYSLTTNWQKTKSLALQNRFEIVRFQKSPSKPEVSYLFYQDIDYSPPSSKLSGNMRLAYFNTQSYDGRIYAFEDDILYNTGFGMYNGKGWRTYVNLKYKLTKKMDMWIRYALFYYPNASLIGSGLDEIAGKIKSDIKLQMRFQF